MGNNIAIVGGGISGMLAAYLLAKEKKDHRIYLIEKSDAIGGLLKSFDYGEHGRFDYGIHIIYETGIRELDEILYKLLDEDEWIVLEGTRNDLGGLFYNGKVQSESPYIDVRNFPEDVYKKSMADFFCNLNNAAESEVLNAYDYAKDRFGETIATSVIGKAVHKLFRKEPHEMDVMATKLTPMNRVVLFNEQIIDDITESPLLRDRVAYIDQRNLPLERTKGRRSFYPKKFGMYRVVEALKAKLISNGVTILTGSFVTGLEVASNKIKAIEVQSKSGSMAIPDIQQLYWTTGFPSLGQLLQIKPPEVPFDRPLRTAVLNLLIDKELDVGDLYYVYCYEAGFNTFRLINYSSFCPAAPRNGAYPVSLELLVEQEDLNDKDALTERSIDELRMFNVLKKDTNILFKKVEVLDGGFPMPTLNNIRNMDYYREQIQGKQMDNLSIFGILSEKNMFFQTDVLADVYKKINYSN